MTRKARDIEAGMTVRIAIGWGGYRQWRVEKVELARDVVERHRAAIGGAKRLSRARLMEEAKGLVEALDAIEMEGRNALLFTFEGVRDPRALAPSDDVDVTRYR